jgi:hypothetical protein
LWIRPDSGSFYGRKRPSIEWFLGKNTNGELPNPGVTVDFIVDIKEVTQQILEGTDKLTEPELSKKSPIISRFTKTLKK